jgi:acyl carrier protein
MATIDTVREILKENLDIDPETVTEDSTFESLNIDSLDMVELICDLEERCDIDFGEPDGIETVGQLVEYIDGLKNA